jgi:hypothetical protein
MSLGFVFVVAGRGAPLYQRKPFDFDRTTQELDLLGVPLSIGQRATLLALKKEAVEGNFKRLARER